MVSNLKRGLSGSRWPMFWHGAAALTIIGLTAGCGGGGKLEAPATVGTAQELAGTAWIEPGTNTTYSFLDDANVDVSKPDMAQPMQGSFTVNNGLVNVSIGLKTLVGTWDGQELVIDGKALTKN